MGGNVFEKREEEIKKYPRFLQDYHFSSKKDREEKIKKFYSEIPTNSIILEGACGKRCKIREVNSDNSNIKKLIGVDLLESSLRLNNDLDFKMVANLEDLPFKESYFDVVNLPAVVEHLQNPEKVFKEVNRILKKGCVLLISTKNVCNPLMAVNKVLPLKIRYWVKKKILKIPGHFLDTFPAPYRCNSSRKMKRVLANLGFKQEQIWFWGWPLIATPSICLFFSMIYERLTDMKWLRFSKPNIWVRFKKI